MLAERDLERANVELDIAEVNARRNRSARVLISVGCMAFAGMFFLAPGFAKEKNSLGFNIYLALAFYFLYALFGRVPEIFDGNEAASFSKDLNRANALLFEPAHLKARVAIIETQCLPGFLFLALASAVVGSIEQEPNYYYFSCIVLILSACVAAHRSSLVSQEKARLDHPGVDVLQACFSEQTNLKQSVIDFSWGLLWLPRLVKVAIKTDCFRKQEGPAFSAS